MPKQALYLKWRPALFEEMVGQDHIVRTLRNALKTGRVRHAYLFSGPRGTGKTTSARLLAKALNCRDENPDNRPCNVCAACVAVNEGRYLDLIEIDAASHTGVDDVRDLRDKIAFAPSEGPFKVYIIDEVHRFSGAAFDALLKTLEEPPPHAVFILATTELDKVPATIKSRSLLFEFRRVSLHEVADRLGRIASDEGVSVDRAALELIARQGTGSVRDSISLLDQIITDPDEHISLEMVQRVLGTANTMAVKDTVAALLMQDAAAGLARINDAVDNGSDPRQFAQQMVEHLRAVLLTQTAGSGLVEASQEDRALFEEEANMVERDRLIRAIRAFNEAAGGSKSGWQPQLPLELAFLEGVKQATAQVVYAAPPAGASFAPTAAAAPAPMAAPVADNLPPGAPPIVQLIAVQDKWNSMLRALSQLNKTAPDLVQNFRAVRVDGNIVYIATDNQMYYERLNVPAKLEIVERALSLTHKIGLKAKIILNQHLQAFEQGGALAVNPDDPLLSVGREMGAEIKPGQPSRPNKGQ